MFFKLRPKACMLTLLGSFILAFGIYNIHSVSAISEGGVLGLTLFIEHWTGISPAISGLIFNVAFYLFGWRTLGNNFIGYSIFACGGFSLFYALIELFPPIYPEIANHPLAAAIIGAVFVGLGCGIPICAGGAPTGDDALAMSLSKIFKVNISVIYLLGDLFTLSLSLTYIPLIRIVYSLITVVISGQIIGVMQRLFMKDDEDCTFTPRDVLVGTLRNTAQLEVALREKFYHIPAVRLYSGNFPINYVAIYQSIHKFGEDAGVYYYGEVTGHKLLRRREISEIPKDSDEEYYRFEIREWKMLACPIPARDGDFINLNTSLFLLENAKNTSELSLLTGSELSLYRKIEKLLARELREVHENKKTIKITSNKRLTVSKKDRTLFSCEVTDYNKNSLSLFRAIFSAINKAD